MVRFCLAYSNGNLFCGDNYYHYTRKKLKKTEDRLFALDEIKSGSVDESVWCEALIAAQGDEDRAKAKYLQIRRKNRPPEKFNNRFLAFFYILGIIFILIYGVIFLAIAYALMFL